MKRAVVLLSGGIDSATTMALAKSEGHDMYALSFDYGQRHKIEIESSRKIAEHIGVKRHLIVNINLRDIGGSALTDDINVPKTEESQESGVKSQDMGKDPGRNSSLLTPYSSSIPATYVPARNTIFLSVALAWAETLEAQDIYIGANALDYSGYPDCRPEFITAFEHVANLATRLSVEGKVKFVIRAPLMKMTKAEIISKGRKLGVDYSLTWSCYDPVAKTGPLGDSFNPCMRCDSCRLRAKGFKEAGVEDPLVDLTAM